MTALVSTCERIRLTAKERAALEERARSHTTQKRYAFRADLVLLTAEGLENQTVALRLKTRPAIAGKWPA